MKRWIVVILLAMPTCVLAAESQTAGAQTQNTIRPSPLENGEAANEEAIANKDHEWWKALWETVLALGTAALACFTMLLWLSTKKLAEDAVDNAQRQSTEMRDSLAVARESAEAAEATANVMMDTAQRQLRAYVSVDSASRLDDIDGRPVFEVRLVNAGQTPAYQVVSWIGIAFREYLLTSPLVRPEANEQAPRSSVGPKALFFSRIVGRTALTAEHQALLDQHERVIYVHGGVTYKDTFGFDRHLNYAFYWGGPRQTTYLRPCIDGNDAS
jgi:hypothetical protein